MPAITPMYVCDFPGCGIQFPATKGYGFSVYAARISDATIGSFSIPGDDQQTLCCSVTHAENLAKDIVDNQMVAMLEAKALEINYTLQMDPPTV